MKMSMEQEWNSFQHEYTDVALERSLCPPNISHKISRIKIE
jgi:hypothetical protein